MDITDIRVEEEQQDKELVIKREIDAVISQMEKLEVKNDEQFEFAADWLKRNKETQKYVEDQFSEELEAAKEKKKQAEAERKAVVKKIDTFNKPLKEAERQTRSMIEQYQNELERQRREEEERRRKEAEEQAAKAEAEGKPAPAPEPVPEKKEVPKTEGVTFYENWTFEIEDESQIPREYMQVDEKKIRQYVKAMKGDAKIPGVKIWCEKKSRVSNG
jgi:acyl transferase domain-containing protein